MEHAITIFFRVSFVGLFLGFEVSFAGRYLLFHSWRVALFSFERLCRVAAVQPTVVLQQCNQLQLNALARDQRIVGVLSHMNEARHEWISRSAYECIHIRYKVAKTHRLP